MSAKDVATSGCSITVTEGVCDYTPGNPTLVTVESSKLSIHGKAVLCDKITVSVIGCPSKGTSKPIDGKGEIVATSVNSCDKGNLLRKDDSGKCTKGGCIFTITDAGQTVVKSK